MIWLYPDKQIHVYISFRESVHLENAKFLGLSSICSFFLAFLDLGKLMVLWQDPSKGACFFFPLIMPVQRNTCSCNVCYKILTKLYFSEMLSPPLYGMHPQIPAESLACTHRSSTPWLSCPWYSLHTQPWALFLIWKCCHSTYFCFMIWLVIRWGNISLLRFSKREREKKRCVISRILAVKFIKCIFYQCLIFEYCEAWLTWKCLFVFNCVLLCTDT